MGSEKIMATDRSLRYTHALRELEGTLNLEHSGRGRVFGIRFLGHSPASQARLSRYKHRIRDVPDLQAYYDLMDRFANDSRFKNNRRSEC